jgi:hypothetical protein
VGVRSTASNVFGYPKTICEKSQILVRGKAPKTLFFGKDKIMRNRNRSFVIRLNDEEFQALEEKRRRSGYPREVFLRKLIADGIVREAPSVDYPKLLLSLSRIGNNLNQITATANTIHYIDPKALEEATRDLKHILKEIHRSFLIPDQQRITEETASGLQHIFLEVQKVLVGQEAASDPDAVLQYIQDAVSERAKKDNQTVRQKRQEADWKEQLCEVPPLYQPFQEGEDLYLYDNRKNGL